jgi:hypothetical protein
MISLTITMNSAVPTTKRKKKTLKTMVQILTTRFIPMLKTEVKKRPLMIMV